MINCKKYFPIVLLVLCVTGWIACTQERDPCLTPKIASLNINTQHLTTDTSTIFVDTALPAAILIPLTTAANKAGTVYPQEANFAISLSPDSTICQWAVTTDSLNPYDTITFYYERKLRFISNACGYTYFYNIDSIHTTHYNIDSIHILNTNVTNNVNTKHLQICIHPGF